ncbi:hypothetical protein JCM3770_002968 [Rhodotorula araucariae]
MLRGRSVRSLEASRSSYFHPRLTASPAGFDLGDVAVSCAFMRLYDPPGDKASLTGALTVTSTPSIINFPHASLADDARPYPLKLDSIFV